MLLSCASKIISMKKFTFVLLLFSFFFMGCSSDDTTYNNPNLLNTSVYFNVNLNLPQYSPLQYPMNPVYVPGYGNAGVIIVNAGGNNYRAFDAADPNHPLQDCSKLLIDGIQGTCQCDDHNTYNLVTGTVVESESNGDSYDYALKPYQVIDNGNGTLSVTN